MNPHKAKEKDYGIKGFPPVVGEGAKVLILGSMPGEESLRLNQYYGFKHNAFWTIMSHLCGFDLALDYDERKQILINNKIAIWDVLRSCEREGSLDSSINKESIEVNDFKTFFSDHSKIEVIFFNGQRAKKEFTRRVKPSLENTKDFKTILLPSTSPAYASLAKEEKLKQWRIIGDFL